ncbi:MAG TPA: right-handed parallel beta-helix repeat-containing protein, partial [Opitutaceae bacterium]
SWVHLRGLEVVGVQVTITGHTQSICFDNQGSHNVYERLSMHDGMAIGLWIGNGAHNLVLNCDAYRNHDPVSGNKRGGNVDGFGYHGPRGSVGNVFRGCRAWFNSDDGFDFINSGEAATIENCWAFYNGYSPDFASLADGNGFKAGGHAGTPVARLPDPIPRHRVTRSLAVRNKANGFYANHHIGGVDFVHNSALRNRVNFNLLGRAGDNRTDVPGYGHVVKNNLGFEGGREVAELNGEKCDVAGNHFDAQGKSVFAVTAKDFFSVDEACLTQPRQPNGDLPDVPLLRLAPGSAAIDRGVALGQPFTGAAPDAGAYELQKK